jgi:hypothetical protein
MLQQSRVPHFWLLICLLSVLLLTAAGRLGTLDDETAFEMTANLIERGQLTIDHQSTQLAVQTYPGFLPRAQPRELITTWSSLGRDGQLYPMYSYGVAVLNIPLYLSGRALGGGEMSVRSVALLRWSVSMLDPIVIALTGWIIALFATRLGYSARLSTGLALVYSLGSLAFAYGHTLYSEPVLGLLITLAAYALYSARLDRSRARQWIVCAGCALGCALYVRERTAIMLPAFLVYIFAAHLHWRIREWSIFLAPIAFAGLLIALANIWRFGSPLTFGYNQLQNASFTTPIVLGVYGLLISPGKGLLVYSPIVWPGLLGLMAALRRRSAEAWLFALAALAELLFYGSYEFWTGGWNWGPRYLLPVLPFLILSAGAWLHTQPTRLRRTILIALGTIGFFINLSAVLVDHSRYLVAFGESDPDHYLNRSIFQPADSPLIQQWPAVFETIGLYLDPEGWSAAQRAITDHLQTYSGPNEVNSVSAHLMGVDEFFRLNLPDFWWLHLPLLGFSPGVIALTVLALLISALVSGRKIMIGLKAEQ